MKLFVYKFLLIVTLPSLALVACSSGNDDSFNEPKPINTATSVGECRPSRTEITGIGMGDRNLAISPQSLVLADVENVESVLVQMSGRTNSSAAPIPGEVTFTSTLPESISLNSPTKSGARGYTFETTMSPADSFTVEVDTTGNSSYRTPRALTLYSTRRTSEDWISVGRLTNEFIYWGSPQATAVHTEILTIPALNQARDLEVTAVVIDNDTDSRPIEVEASAGGIVERVTELGPSDGESLNIIEITLEQVPAGTDQVEVTFSSLEANNGDSSVLVGLNVSHRCTVDNRPLVANAGPDQSVAEGETVQLDGSGSVDADGDPLTFEWVLVSIPEGSMATLSDPTAVQPTFIADLAGDYVARLVVNDGTLDSDPDTVTVTITTTINIDPVASFTSSVTTGSLPLMVNFDASGSSDPDGSIASYSWDFGDGNSATGAMNSHTFSTVGTFTVTLTVTDNEGSSDTRTATITTTTINVDPVASFTSSVTAGSPPLMVDFDASGSSDPDGSIAQYAWDFGDGSSGTGTMVSHTFTGAGSFTVSLTVTDNDGSTDARSTVIEVNGFPMANIAPDVTSGSEPLMVAYDATASVDADGTIAAYRWDFGDGSTGAGPVVDHTYTEAGSFDVVLTVTDDDGASDTATVTIVVATNPSRGLAAILKLLILDDVP